MSPDAESPIMLQVASSNERDVGKGTARLPETVLEELGLRPGSVIEIIGEERTTGAVVLPPYPEDVGLSLIRVDGLIRANVNVGIGDHVEVRPVEARAASKVTFAPAQKNVMLEGSGQALLRTFLQRPVKTGDVVSTSVYRRTAGTDPGMSEDYFARLFGQQRAFALAEIRLLVTATKPRGIVRIGPETDVELLTQYTEPGDPRQTGVTYDDVGGMSAVTEQIREMIELPLKHPELFRRLGIDPPKGVLLHGPPGTGKTLLARAVATESDAQFFNIAGPEIMGSQYGESERRLREVFEEAQQSAPAIIFFDEIDSIAPKRSETRGEVERRVVAQLLALMDGLEPRQNVVVIGATNRVDSLDEALRRPGRFDREIVVGVPDHDGRRQILSIHTRGMPLADDVDLEEFARVTYGFVGADLAALCREAAIDALRRALPDISLDGEVGQDVLEGLEVESRDFEAAVKRVQPSALREIMIQVPDVTWDDIGGVEDAKTALREGVELPLKSPDSFTRLGIRPAKGFLLFGPPGTGKTLMAKAVAREAEANFIATKSSDLLSKWYGESEQQISRLFKRARQVAPTVIFIDEIDSLAPQRGGGMGEPAVTERVVNTLLAEMDGLEALENVIVIGATNRPTLLDPALLRPGRFDEVVYTPVPDAEGRQRILEIHTSDMPLSEDVDLSTLAEKTPGFTGADLENLTRRAGLMALRRDIDAVEISQELFEEALETTHASVTPEMESEYEEMASSLKQESARVSKKLGFQID